MEDPTTEIHKTLHEEAEKSRDRGIMKIALTSALIAVPMRSESRAGISTPTRPCPIR